MNSSLTPIEAILNDTLVQDAFWTYNVTSRSELKGTDSYEGDFVTSITVSGRGTIKHLNSSALIIEKKEKIDISVSGSGYYKQESKSDHYEFTTTSMIDRQRLTYVSRKIKNEIENRESDDNSTIGLPVTEFVSTTLKEGQKVTYYTIDGNLTCTVFFSIITFQGEDLPVIKLSYSGLTVQDPWLEANGNAEHTFNFEKTTGLLVSSSSKTSTIGQKGTRLTIYNYELTSTSIWNKSSTPSGTIISTENSKSEATIEPGKSSTRIDYAPIFIVIGIGIILWILVKKRKDGHKPKKES